MGDPMDLGGFLQNFVLKNPFNEAGLQGSIPTTSIASPVKATGGNTDTKAPCLRLKSPKINGSKGSCNYAGNPSRYDYIKIAPNPGLSPLVSATTTSSNVASVITVAPHASVPLVASTVKDANVCSSSDHSKIDVDEVSGKAYVGSNVKYAINLKMYRVSEANKALQKWLWGHYKFVSSHNFLYPNKLLLTELKTKFPSTTSMVLSHVMKFTFPDCQKVINKSGYYFQGLVRRPTKAQVNDPDLRKIALCVYTGEMFLSNAASSGKYTLQTIAGMLHWVISHLQSKDQLEVYGPEIYNNMIENHVNEVKRLLGSAANIDVKGDVPDVSGQMSKKKCSKRLKSTRKRKCLDDNWTESDDDFEYCNTSSPTMLPKRRLRRSPKKTAKYSNNYVLSDDDNDLENSESEVDENSADNVEEDSLSRERSPSVDSKITDCFTKLKNEINNDKADHCDNDSDNDGEEIRVEKLGTIQVKQEPVDNDYDSIQSNPDTNSLQSNTSKQLENKNDGNKCSNEPMVGMLRTVASKRHNVMRIQMLEKEVQHSQARNQQLCVDLKEAQDQVRSLQGQIHSRDIMLAQLAENFFDLNNRFQTLSQQFKQALSGTLQSNYNNNELVQSDS